MPLAVIYICTAMLLIGAAPLPYGYYTLLRIVACGVFAFSAFISYERKHNLLPWVFGLLALLFNPIITVHLPKEVWAIIDIAAGIFLFFTAKSVRANA
jgi:FtsH-binding integral membrane protein